MKTPRSSREKVVQQTVAKSRDDQSFTKVSSPKTMMEKLPLGDSSLMSDFRRNDSSLHAFQPLSARSNKSGMSSSTITAKGDNFDSPQSVRSVISEGRNNKDDTLTETQRDEGSVGRKTPTDLLVDEIMGEGEILSPFNSGKYCCFKLYSSVRTSLMKRSVGIRWMV